MPETFHRRGHHVQKAHGHRTTLAAQDDHLSGGMIALLPTVEDAKRLALPGGEKAAELHCTQLFLGNDGSVFSSDDRDHIEEAVRAYVQGLGPVQANIFGVAHWNGDGEKPSWVWSVGDGPGQEGPGLAKVHSMIYAAAEDAAGDLIPEQHSPWVAHICAAYTDDLTLVRALEKRLGPVTFDRIRLSFGQEDRDISLTESLTASALRRDVLDHETDTDFAEHNAQWENAVQATDGRLLQVFSAWRAGIREQIQAGLDTPGELTGLQVDPDQAAEILSEAMLSLAHRAGQSLARQAEKQGVQVPDWSLPDDVVTAAVGGRKLLRSVARMTADLLSTSVLQTAKRTVTGLFAKDASPETIAAEVDRALSDARDGLLKGPVGTAMSTAQTAGREAVLRAAPPGEYYASEMLDRNTCGPCRAVDGEQFSDLEIAVKAYPVMGYKDCVGPRYGHSCRGMIVARWTPEEPVTAAGSGLDFHGSLGDPGYHALHPGNAGKGKTRSPHGGMLGSPDFTEEEHTAALGGYIREDSHGMNSLLQTGESAGGLSKADAEARNKVLNDLIDIQDPLKESKTLYRGGYNFPSDLKPGDEITDRGFTSFSDRERTGRRFAGQSKTRRDKTKPQGTMATVTVPAGTRILQVASVNPEDDLEQEWIGRPGSTFKVTGVGADGLDIGLEMIS